MAHLINTNTQQKIILRTQHIFGRHSGSSHTILDNPEASRLHASIYWNGTHWLIQDTSSNGTFLNRAPVSAGIKKRLKEGDSIQFGAMDASLWILKDNASPKSLLMPLVDDLNPIELDGVVVLPNEESPDLSLYQDSNGQWVAENQFGVTLLDSGVKVSAADESWVFIDAETADNTRQADHTLNKGSLNFKAQFTVSKNEEHVSMTLSNDQSQINLGERTHHYLMLVLARERLKDLRLGIEDSEQGWIDKNLLCQQTGLDEKYINLQIYRLRKQIIQASPSIMQLLQIIERRRGTLRFALTSIGIRGGNDINNTVNLSQ